MSDFLNCLIVLVKIFADLPGHDADAQADCCSAAPYHACTGVWEM